MNKFTLEHLTLYSKGWYKKYNNRTIWEDLAIILTVDGYSGEYMSQHDIYSVILNQCSRLKIPAFTELLKFADGISPEECWKYGYYTSDHTWVLNKRGFKDKLKPYNMKEAAIYYCLSNLRCCEIKDIFEDGYKLVAPDYKKGLPKPNGMSKKKLSRFRFLTIKD